jgi:hypothetical protein
MFLIQDHETPNQKCSIRYVLGNTSGTHDNCFALLVRVASPQIFTKSVHNFQAQRLKCLHVLILVNRTLFGGTPCPRDKMSVFHAPLKKIPPMLNRAESYGQSVIQLKQTFAGTV